LAELVAGLFLIILGVFASGIAGGTAARGKRMVPVTKAQRIVLIVFGLLIGAIGARKLLHL
jgi:threonine/homoserine/homoserine lactone efflux protein